MKKNALCAMGLVLCICTVLSSCGKNADEIRAKAVKATQALSYIELNSSVAMSVKYGDTKNDIKLSYDTAGEYSDSTPTAMKLINTIETAGQSISGEYYLRDGVVYIKAYDGFFVKTPAESADQNYDITQYSFKSVVEKTGEMSLAFSDIYTENRKTVISAVYSSGSIDKAPQSELDALFEMIGISDATEYTLKNASLSYIITEDGYVDTILFDKEFTFISNGTDGDGKITYEFDVVNPGKAGSIDFPSQLDSAIDLS